MKQRLIQIKKSAQDLRRSSTDARNGVLREAAKLLARRQDELLRANAEDLRALESGKATPAFRDRLMLDLSRVKLMAESLEQVAALGDPIDEEVEHRTLKNGLLVRRVRAPLGVILMIFESRPNVAIEAFSLGFKAGNAMILRGGKESMRTTAVLYDVLSTALRSHHLPVECLWGITDPDRAVTQSLLKESSYIDVVVPRGGDQLIQFVVENAQMPIIKNDRGMCHAYVHVDADLGMAEDIVVNAKCQRPGVCNAVETLLVHEVAAPKLLPRLHELMKSYGVEWHCCDRSLAILKGQDKVSSASASDFDTEYLDYKINCKVVDSLDEAIAHIEEHGSRHSEAIITASEKVAREFQARIDAAAVYWNASTRFTDGYELGLGGELGISTQKLHVRGPVGLRELTSVRWVIDGTGQVRG